MPKFSVIVPIYKVENFINKCIDSILSQTFQDFELILVDDGSPDNCPKICDDYAKKDGRVKVVHKENGGLVSARKVGASIAKGEYCCCVDGDDWLDNDCLLKCNEVIEQYDVDLICFAHYKAYADKLFFAQFVFESGYYDKKRKEGELLPYVIHGSNIKYFMPSIWSKIYKTDTYVNEQMSVSDTIKIGEDGACTIPCVIKSQGIYLLNEPLYYYRQNEQSMTKDKKPFAWNGPFDIYSHLQSRINVEENDYQMQLNRKFLHDLFNVAMTRFYQDKSYFEVRKEIKEKLNADLVKQAIKNCKFSCFKGKLMVWALKHKITILMKLYSRVHSF